MREKWAKEGKLVQWRVDSRQIGVEMFTVG